MTAQTSLRQPALDQSPVQNTPKFAYIDALRGWAILGVLIVHCSQHGSVMLPSLLDSVVKSGEYGVQLFYVVSAMTLFLSMDSRKQHEKRPTLNFFIRRFFRIAPMFYVAVAYYLWQNGWGHRFWLGDAPRVTLANLIATLTFTNGINPHWITSIVEGGWSVAVEFNFYLLVPFLYRRIKNIKAAIWLMFMSMVVSTLIKKILLKTPFIQDLYLWKAYLYFFFPSQVPVFLCGVILYFLVRKKPAESLAVTEGWLPGPRHYMLCAVLLAGVLAPQWAIEPYWIFSLVYILAGYALSRDPIGLFVNPVTAYIGKISFSLYLIHNAVIHFMTAQQWLDFSSHPILNYALRFLLLLGLSSALASITYYCIEKPGQALGKRFINRLEMAAR